uniref:Docking protein 7 n=1 Tax=Salvator merianae TaxID=96440 RepID=A0A8D0EFR2_SALMN
MTDSAVVVEGQLKWRDGKKWKNRWVVLRKPSPVADCLLMLIYKERSERLKGLKERSSITLEDICGLDPGLCYEGLNHTLAIICLAQVVMLGFENKETMNAWDIRIRYSLGEGAGVFFLSCTEGEKISFLFDCIVHGISPMKGPFGLLPALPDPSTNPVCMEERVAHEALQLEKRLSLLSHTSYHGSGGDDRSLSSSSSDTSHSDASIGSRLTIWADQSLASTSQECHVLPSAKGIFLGEEKPHSESICGMTKPQPKLLRSRQLQEIGRQSSSDSGIATGSHSSYSGSFSSYAGSLDICHSDEFGSLLSLPLNLPSEHSVCTCSSEERQRSPGADYQVPSSLRHVYDTPKSLLKVAAKDVHSSSSDSPISKGKTLQGISDLKLLALQAEAQAAPQHEGRNTQTAFALENTKDLALEGSVDFVSKGLHLKQQGQLLDSKSTDVVPVSGASSSTCELCNSPSGVMRAVFSSCPVCGGLKETSILPSGVLSTNTGAVGYLADLSISDRLRSEMATYVNIPTSPTSKKQLHYMELELQEPSTSIRGCGSTKYAQIDITATETAHKVGTQHAQFREERLQELEQKKKGSQTGSS